MLIRFAVNQEKKLHWNDEWYKRGSRGKVVGGLLAACVVLAVACLVWWASTGFFASAGADAEGELLSIAACAAMLFFAVVAIVLAAVFPAMRREPLKTSAEAMEVQGDWLVMSYHRTADPSPSGLDVAYAHLPECRWGYHAPTGKLAIRGRDSSSIRSWHYNDPMREAQVPLESMEYADMMFFYPFYDPDPREVLRSLGVPEDPDIMRGVH